MVLSGCLNPDRSSYRIAAADDDNDDDDADVNGTSTRLVLETMEETSMPRMRDQDHWMDFKMKSVKPRP